LPKHLSIRITFASRIWHIYNLTAELWVPPNSSILSEFYLQQLGSNKIWSFLLNLKVGRYFRYVDVNSIVYNEENTNTDTLLDHFNSLSPKLKFTTEKEKNDPSTSWT
jgi:hypothetical protein